jgi:hypothetical protein
MRAFPEQQVVALSRRAFSCSDELGALVILTLIPGASAAGASAILTAHDPTRYTVMDVRALQSLITLDLWSEGQGLPRHALLGLSTLTFAGELQSDLIDRCEVLTGHYGQPRAGFDVPNGTGLKA